MDEKEKKQQFNVYLSPELIRKVKHAAVDVGYSLSLFVEKALEAYLDKLQADSQQQNEESPYD